MLLIILYEFILGILALGTFPYFCYQLIFHKKYRQSFKRRWGTEFNHLNCRKVPLIWIHAVSMGETKAISQLVKQLKKNTQALILMTSVTETGHAEAKKGIPEADFHLYLPFDFGWLIRPLVKKVNPTLVIISETDFWYNFLKAAKGEGASIVLVNGKLSRKSLQRFKIFSSFSSALFSLIDLFCLQNEHYKNRFAQLTIPLDKMIITGNLKLDQQPLFLTDQQKKERLQQLNLTQQDLILVLGSSHQSEEKLILSVFKELLLSFPQLKLLIVPRHPERFQEVATLLAKQNLNFLRWTNCSEEINKAVSIILIDQMGLLNHCYQLATIAIVGGSYIATVGGHNIIEPCWYGVPVIYGPCMYSQLELVQWMETYRAGLQVEKEQLLAVLKDLLIHPFKRKELGINGLRLVKDKRGATEKTLHALISFIKKMPIKN